MDFYRKNIEELENWKVSQVRKPLILKGARQVGKTWLLKEFGRRSFGRVHYCNFEEQSSLKKIFAHDLNPNQILDDLSLILRTGIDEKHDLLIFDEIQACPRALTSLKYFYENKRQLAVCAAGSLLGVYLNEQESFPVGCVDYLDIYPMSFLEFLFAYEPYLGEQFKKLVSPCHITPLAHEQYWNLFKEYLIVGGLPEVVKTYVNYKNKDAFTAYGAVRSIQKKLVQSYIADIAKHSGKLNALHIEQVWQSSVNQLSKAQENVQKFLFKNVLAGHTGFRELSGPIHWLKKAGLVLESLIADCAQIPPNAFTKENRFKLYHFDTGLLGCMAQIPPESIVEFDFGTYKGFFVENFVAQELVCAGRGPLISWNEGSAEIEFLLTHKNNIIPVEVKSGRSRQGKSLKIYSQKYKPRVQIILSGQLEKSTESQFYCPLYLAGSLCSMPFHELNFI